MRAFVAVNLDVKSLEKVVSLQQKLRRTAENAGAKVAWVPPPNLHVTLKFLGNIPQESAPAIRHALGQKLDGWSPFSVRLPDLGAFPSRDRARILWVGLESQDQRLNKLAEEVEHCLSELGFAKEQRSFHPHVTLGRVKRGGQDKQDLLAGVTAEDASQSRINEVVVYQSKLAQKGAEYTPVARVVLGAAAKRGGVSHACSRDR